MEKRINNFLEFRINEAKDTLPKAKEALLNVFWDELNEITETMELSWSYSYKAQDSEAYNKEKKNRNPYDDFKKMLSLFAEKGWTKKALNTLFEKYGKDIIEKYDDGNGQPISGSAGTDIFLYFMTKGTKVKEPLLAGYDYMDMIKSQGPGEYWIKFGYGYQNTPYGELVIKQQFGSVEKWLEYGASILLDTLFSKEEMPEIDYNVDKLADVFEAAGVNVDKAKAALAKGLKFDGHNVLEIDLKKFKSMVPVEQLPKVLSALYEAIFRLGFYMPDQEDKWIKGGRGKVSGDTLRLSMEL